MNWKSVSRICFGVSCVVNIGVLSVVGARAKQAESVRLAAARESRPSRLVEIRKLSKLSSPPIARSKPSDRLPRTQETSATRQGKSGSSSSSSVSGDGAITGELKPTQENSTSLGSPDGLKHIPINAKMSWNGVLAIKLQAPKPQVSAGYNGVLDLQNSKIDIRMNADRSLLPKGKPKPNTFIGKSTVEWIGGKPKMTAVCVGVVGGNTLYASHIKIKGAKNVTISGTKFCGTGGGLPIPLGSGRSHGTSASPSKGSSKGKASGPGSGSSPTGFDFHASGDQTKLAQNYLNLATGPHHSQPYLKDTGGSEPGVQGEFRPVHLPEVDTVRTLNDSEPKKELTAEDKRAEKGLQPKIGSLSPNGSLPWGPAKAKPKHGLLADFYIGREFQSYQFTRRTAYINFNWDNVRPDTQLPEFQPYSVRWTGYIKPTTTETYTVFTASDDGVRLWIDDRLVIDNWTCHAESEDAVQVSLNSGVFHRIRLEYFEASGLRGQRIRLYWESPSVRKEYVPENCLYYAKS